MSKKPITHHSTFKAQPALEYEAEYQVIRHDLIRLFILNLLYLVGILVLYYTNRQSHYLEAWFNRFVN